MELPEIHELIATHLSHRDKFQCLLVSKTWHQFYIQSLWERILIRNSKNFCGHPSQEKFSILMAHHLFSLHGRQVFSNYSHLISELQIESYKSLNQVTKTTLSNRGGGCINLKTLSFGNRFRLDFEAPSTPEGTLVKISNDDGVEDDNDGDQENEPSTQIPLITTVNSRRPKNSAPRIAYAQDLIKLLKANPGLTKLDLVGLSTCMDGTEIQALGKALEDPDCSPKLESLVIIFRQPLGMASVLDACAGRVKVWSLGIIGGFEPLTKDCLINELFLEDIRYQSEEQVIGFFKHLPGLKSLSVDESRSFPSTGEMTPETAENLKNSLVQSCPLLDTISLNLGGEANDATVAHLVGSNAGGGDKGWISVNIKGNDSIPTGPLTNAAMLKHTSTLQQVEIEACGGFDSQSIQVLLATAPKLKTFWTLQEDETIMPVELKLTGADIVRGPTAWACKDTLEMFGTVISGIPRPDIKKRQDGRVFEPSASLVGTTIDQSRTLQRSVCSRLGSLINLKSLILGHDDRDFGMEMSFDTDTRGRPIYQDMNWQYECLELSLESGLDLLSGLKELEVLDVQRMSHRIGVAEVVWMSENWPKLKTIGGLAYDGEKESAAVVWLRKHRPDIRVGIEASNFWDGMGSGEEEEQDEEVIEN